MNEGGRLILDSSLLKGDTELELIAGTANGRSMPLVDNRIIALAWFYKQKHNGNTVFVSKDINARVKAMALGIKAEDYKNDKIDVSAIYSCYLFPTPKIINELHQNREVSLDDLGAAREGLLENQCVVLTCSINGSSSATQSALGVVKGTRVES